MSALHCQIAGHSKVWQGGSYRRWQTGSACSSSLDCTQGSEATHTLWAASRKAEACQWHQSGFGERWVQDWTQSGEHDRHLWPANCCMYQRFAYTGKYTSVNMWLDCLPALVQCQAAMLDLVSQWLLAVLLCFKPTTDLRRVDCKQCKILTTSHGFSFIGGQQHFPDQAKSPVHYKAAQMSVDLLSQVYLIHWFWVADTQSW